MNVKRIIPEKEAVSNYIRFPSAHFYNKQSAEQIGVFGEKWEKKKKKNLWKSGKVLELNEMQVREETDVNKAKEKKKRKKKLSNWVKR